MIRFACPHCGRQQTVDDRLSGRDGWCSLRMGVLAVPRDAPSHSREFTPAEGLRSLRELLKAAEARFEVYREGFRKPEQPAGALDKTQKPAETASGLRVLPVRAEELDRANEMLASEEGFAVRTAGPAETRIAALSRELERLSRDLERERSLRRNAEDRAAKPLLPAFPPLVSDGAIVTLVPELVEPPEADDPMMRTLMRFIEPE